MNENSKLEVALKNRRINWEQGRTPSVLDLWPEQKLIAISGEFPEGTDSRWLNAGGKIIDGEMRAHKNDPVWAKFSEFGLPYPPFDARTLFLIEVEDCEKT